MTVMQEPPGRLQSAGPRGVARPKVSLQNLHHLAYMTQDTEATADFYSRILGLPLVNAVLDDHVPSTKAPLPYFHSFFRLATGETIAFFECPGSAPPPPKTDPAQRDFEHLALEVPTRADVDAWREWLSANGISVISNDHGIIYSIYFRDPVNDIRLEITTTIDREWNAQEESARTALDEWASTKQTARASGKDVTEALREFAAAYSHSARLKLTKPDA
jgi:catechol 2,3-dioxygenase-like lactoylglutathione lyase family enzyme